MRWSLLLILLSFFSSCYFAQEAEDRSGNYKQNKPKGLSREERRKLNDFAARVDPSHSYEASETSIEEQLKENSRIFPIFVTCVLLFALLLSYNYLIGLTSNKEKLLKDLESSSDSKQAAQHREAIQKINNKKK